MKGFVISKPPCSKLSSQNLEGKVNKDSNSQIFMSQTLFNQFERGDSLIGLHNGEWLYICIGCIDSFDAYFVLCTFLGLKSTLKCTQGNRVPKLTSVSKKTSQSIMRKQITLQKWRYVVNVSNGNLHFWLYQRLGEEVVVRMRQVHTQMLHCWMRGRL